MNKSAFKSDSPEVSNVPHSVTLVRSLKTLYVLKNLPSKNTSSCVIHTYIHLKRKGTRVNKNWHYTNASRRTKRRQPPIQYATKIKLHEKKSKSQPPLSSISYSCTANKEKYIYTLKKKKNSCVVKSPVQPHKE